MSVIYPQHQQARQQGSKTSTDNDETQNRKFLLRMVEEVSQEGQDIAGQWNIFEELLPSSRRREILTNIYCFL